MIPFIQWFAKVELVLSFVFVLFLVLDETILSPINPNRAGNRVSASSTSIKTVKEATRAIPLKKDHKCC